MRLREGCARFRGLVPISASVGQRTADRPKQASKKAQRLAERIVTLSWEHPRYGYRRIRALLVKEGWAASRKFVQAVRRSSGLQVKPPKKRRHRQGVSTGSPTKATGRNHVWSWVFVHDRTDNGGPLKMMTLIDVPRS